MHCSAVYSLYSIRPDLGEVEADSATFSPQVGRSLTEEEAANLSDEQREQLFRLKQQTSASGGTAARDVTKP